MRPTSQEISTLYPLFLSKIQQLRQAFTEHGYSQSEFQLYFLTQVLTCPFDHKLNVSQSLANQLKSITSNQKIQQILATIDRQVETIRILKQIKEKEEYKRESKESVSYKNNGLGNRRKNSRESKQSKKDKKSKEQKRKNPRRQEQSDQNSDSITFLKDRTSDLVNIFLRENNASNPIIAFKRLTEKDQDFQDDKSQNEQNHYEHEHERREACQKQKIFQKLLEIQLLSKLLCTDSHNDLLRNQYNPFLMRC